MPVYQKFYTAGGQQTLCCMSPHPHLSPSFLSYFSCLYLIKVFKLIISMTECTQVYIQVSLRLVGNYFTGFSNTCQMQSTIATLVLAHKMIHSVVCLFVCFSLETNNGYTFTLNFKLLIVPWIVTMVVNDM